MAEGKRSNFGCFEWRSAATQGLAVFWLQRSMEPCLSDITAANYTEHMKSLTVRLPDRLVREIEAESRERDCAKSDVVRERLQRGAGPTSSASARLNLLADLIGAWTACRPT